MFVGRERELEALQSRWVNGGFECTVIYGRRRVGKTALINQFCKDKPTVYYQAVESDITRNVEALSTSIALYRNEQSSLDAMPTYQGFAEAIEAVFALAEHERIAFVIDEYPYLARSDASVSSILQHAIDNHKSSSKLMMILCGSSMSFMASQVLGYESPLYGRRTSQVKVEPFDFAQSCLFHQQLTAEEALCVYGLTGGIPLYLEKYDASLGIIDNLERNFLDPSCYLFEEPSNLLKQALRDPKQYNNVLQSIADGASKLNEIAAKSHISTSSCSFLIDNLQELGIVTKELPYGETSTRKGIYQICDSFFRFWYRYVPRHLQLIQSGRAHIAASCIAETLPEFEGPVFERVCMQWLWNHCEEIAPPLLLDTSRWWGTNPRTRAQEEIDIVATGEPKGTAILAECKWKSEPVGVSVLEKLAERSQLLPFGERQLYVFSKTRFTSGCEERASELGARLVLFDEMCGP